MIRRAALFTTIFLGSLAAHSAVFDALDLWPGARDAALGEPVAHPSGVESGQINPAAPALLPAQEVSLQRGSYIEDTVFHTLSYALPTEKHGAWTASLLDVGYGDIAAYDTTGLRNGGVDAGTRGLRLGHARPLGRHATWGASLLTATETLGSRSARATAMDVGALWRPAKGFFSRFQAGAALRNLGGKVAFEREKEELPRTLQLGAAYLPVSQPFGVHLDVAQTPALTRFSVGGEYWVKEAVALRLAYSLPEESGAGLKMGVGVRVADAQLDFAYLMIPELGGVMRAGISWRFGSVAEKYYRRGVQKMAENRYAEAIMEFDKAVTLDPRHERALLRMKDAYEKLKSKLQNREN